MKRTDQLAALTIIMRITTMKIPVDLHTARCSISRVNRSRVAGAVITRRTYVAAIKQRARAIKQNTRNISINQSINQLTNHQSSTSNPPPTPSLPPTTPLTMSAFEYRRVS